jgi:hypothetical protein
MAHLNKSQSKFTVLAIFLLMTSIAAQANPMTSALEIKDQQEHIRPVPLKITRKPRKGPNSTDSWILNKKYIPWFQREGADEYMSGTIATSKYIPYLNGYIPKLPDFWFQENLVFYGNWGQDLAKPTPFDRMFELSEGNCRLTFKVFTR